jgi:hypothetical protein
MMERKSDRRGRLDLGYAPADNARMRDSQRIRERPPVEQTLGAELHALGDDDVVEMTNLQEDDTGIPGVIFISTAMGAHGPRVKYFLKAGRDQPSFSVSISDEPEVLANSLSERELKRASPAVRKWVRLNKEALLRFWNEGDSYSIREVVDLVNSLKKV